MNDGQYSINRERRSGQTLAEFAITLPILLLLLFGIIEFGRIFQAWVTLQNSAREAIRMATTGAYDDRVYNMLNLEFVYNSAAPAAGQGDLNSIVPCEFIDYAAAGADTVREAQRGQLVTVYPNDPGNPADAIEVYVNGVESLYATWYGGDDCDPSDPEDQDRRKDMVRLLTIYDVAREGAAGLALNDQTLGTPVVGNSGGMAGITVTGSGVIDPAAIASIPWFRQWFRPLPGDTDGAGPLPPEYTRITGSDQPGFFDLTICSSRPKLDINNQPNTGFHTDEATRFSRNDYMEEGDPRVPVCLLREEPIENSSADLADFSRNGGDGTAGTPWLDAGGPGDTVWIVITFNHPLITPIRVAPFLPLTARRTGVNETFRNPRPLNLEGSQPGNNVNADTATPSATATETHTPTATNTGSQTPTATNTSTPTATDVPPFACTSLGLGQATFVGQTVRWPILNSAIQDTELKRVALTWPNNIPPLSPAVTNMTLDGSVIWSGNDPTSQTIVGRDDIVPAVGAAEYPFAGSANLLLTGEDNTIFTALVNNIGPNISDIVVPSDFNGTTFYIDDPDSDEDCVLTYTASITLATPTPTGTLNTPTFTPTPDCVAGTVRTGFSRYYEFDNTVVWYVTNNTSVPETIVGFDFQWVQYDPPGIWLTHVWAGGTGPSAGLGSQMVWSSTDMATEDFSADTVGYDPTAPGYASVSGSVEGEWQAPGGNPVRVTIAPGQTLLMYMRFAVDGGDALRSLPENAPGASPVDHNNSTIYLFRPSCSDVITVTAQNPPTSTFTPTATFTATNTNTPTNTLTPTRTFTRTPSFTRTFTFTPSNTFTPTNTSTPTNTFTPSNTWTPSNTPTRTFTRTPSFTRTPTRTRTATLTPSITNTRTQTFTPSSTFTPSNTFTPSLTFTPSDTPIPPTATFTRTPTRTPSITPTRTPTNTWTPSFTPSRTPTHTNTYTASFTPTVTSSLTPSRTFTPSNTPTATHTRTSTFTPSPTATATLVPTSTWTPSRTPTRTPTEEPTEPGGGCGDGTC